MATFMSAPTEGEPALTEPHVMAVLRKAMNEMHLNYWCGICGSAELQVEIRPTKYDNIGQAAEAIVQATLAQTLTRTKLDAAGLTFDARQKMNLSRN